MRIITIIVVLLGIAGRAGAQVDLSDLVDPAAYWKLREIEPTAAAMLEELRPVAPADVAAEITRLGSDDFAQRQAAAARLVRAGESARAALEKAAKSADPEVAARAGEILATLDRGTTITLGRQAMALRRLAELKHAAALPRVDELAKSADPLAEYASRAAAAIRGQAPAARKIPEPRVDLARLPADVGMAVRYVPVSGAVALAKFAEVVGQGMFDVPADVEAKAAGWLERVGQVRVDSATLGISRDIENNSGYMVFVFRGRFNHVALAAAIAGNERESQVRPGGAVYVTYMPQAGILFAPECVVMVAHPPAQKADIAMLEDIVAGKEGLLGDKAAAELLKRIDADSPIAGIFIGEGKLAENMGLKHAKSAILSSKSTAAGITVSLSATAKSEDDAATMATMINDLAVMAAQFAVNIDQNPQVPPMAKWALESAKSITGTNAKDQVSASIKVSTELLQGANHAAALAIIAGHEAAK